MLIVFVFLIFWKEKIINCKVPFDKRKTSLSFYYREVYSDIGYVFKEN